jgi:hypothetical protein
MTKKLVGGAGSGKLVLGKETLRRLSPDELGEAAGGSTIVGSATNRTGLCESGAGGCGGTSRCTLQMPQVAFLPSLTRPE